MTSTRTPIQNLGYDGPTEVLLKTPVTLSGTYNPQQIARVTLVAEDRYPFTVSLDAAKGRWTVKLNEGFYTVGARWLRLRGIGRDGKILGDRVINLAVSAEPKTVGEKLILKVLRDTLFKKSPADSATLSTAQKVLVKAGQTFTVKSYGYVDGHLKLELHNRIEPIGSFGYFYAPHVDLLKGPKALKFSIADVPTTIRGATEMLVTARTYLKASPVDSSSLGDEDKIELLLGQSFSLTGYTPIAGHFRVSLIKPIAGFGKEGYVYWQHVQLKKAGRLITFDPNALTLTTKQTTILKKRPVDSSNLQPNERFTLPGGTTYGVSGYAPADGHIKVALTENLPQFGNTGYVFDAYVELKRGNQVIDLSPAQVELNVPHFSQRDNPRYPRSTCNVTAIAMVLHFYGLRSRSGGQLEDELLEWCLSHYGEGSQTEHSVLAEMVRAYGYRDTYSTNRTWAQIRNEISSGRPVVVGGYFTDTGHIVCIIGYTANGYIVNDPWGDALSGYKNTEGAKVVYPASYMSKMCCPEGDGNIWAHFISR